MPDHVHAKNLGQVKPTLWTPAQTGNLKLDKTENGGLLVRITCQCQNCGVRIEPGVELSPKLAINAGYKILYAFGHPPIVSPPGFDNSE